MKRKQVCVFLCVYKLHFIPEQQTEDLFGGKKCQKILYTAKENKFTVTLSKIV